MLAEPCTTFGVCFVVVLHTCGVLGAVRARASWVRQELETGVEQKNVAVFPALLHWLWQ